MSNHTRVAKEDSFFIGARLFAASHFANSIVDEAIAKVAVTFPEREAHIDPRALRSARKSMSVFEVFHRPAIRPANRIHATDAIASSNTRQLIHVRRSRGWEAPPEACNAQRS